VPDCAESRRPRNYREAARGWPHATEKQERQSYAQILVEAESGDGTTGVDFFMHDKYCEDRFAGTLQLGNYMLATTLMGDVITVLRDMDSYRRLESYSTDQFEIFCG
jgi:hypothetical protein